MGKQTKIMLITEQDMLDIVDILKDALHMICIIYDEQAEYGDETAPSRLEVLDQ
jgi:hypothetical protein